MSDTLFLEVVTPQKKVFCGLVPEVRFSTRYRGEHRILPGHTPLITLVGSGLLRFTTHGHEHWMTLFGGIVEVGDDRVGILARESETVDPLDLIAIRTGNQMAQKALREARSELNLVNAEVALERSFVREGAVNPTMLLWESDTPRCPEYGCEGCKGC